MDFNTTIDLIIKELEEARVIIDDLKKYPGVPVLQIELARLKCKSAGEVIALLKNMNNTSADKTSDTGIQKDEPLSVFIEEEELFPPLQKVDVSDSENNNENETDLNATDIFSTEPFKEIKTEVTTISDTKIVKESAIIADKFSHLSSSYNEQLGNRNSDEEMSEIMQKNPIHNLPEAIGVNDRFLFIREIFNNNAETYTQAISRLDKTESLTDARAIIMSYTGNSEENRAAKQLLELVKRKLRSHE